MKTNIIHRLIAGTATLLVLNACQPEVKNPELQKQVASTEQLTRDSLEKVYIATLDEIDHNLDAIRDKEGFIIIGPNSNMNDGVSKKEQIIKNISMINTLLEDNKAKIKNLEKSLVSYKRGKKELVNSINQAKERIAMQEKEIADLKQLLSEQEFKIADLNKKLDEKTMLAESLNQKSISLEKDLNKVYFACGTYKELHNKNILKKEGGIIGIGRVKTLNRTLDKTAFSELSEKENTVLTINGKNPKLITKHPENSYNIVKTGDDVAQLTINNAESFWSTSRYLVVEVR